MGFLFSCAYCSTLASTTAAFFYILYATVRRVDTCMAILLHLSCSLFIAGAYIFRQALAGSILVSGAVFVSKRLIQTDRRHGAELYSYIYR